MKRSIFAVLCIASFLFLAASNGGHVSGAPNGARTAEGGQPGDYVGWTLSASPDDPYDNVRSFVSGPNHIYLWITCGGILGGRGGIWSAEHGRFSVVADDPANLITSFTPEPGVSNSGTETDLLLWITPCTSGPFLAGGFEVIESVPGTWCFAPLPSGTLSTISCDDCCVEEVGCHPPCDAVLSIDWIGLASGTGTPCSGGPFDGEACIPPSTPIKTTSWGEIKSAHR